MKRIWLVVTTVLLAAMVLTACGQKVVETPVVTEPPVTEPVVTEAPAEPLIFGILMVGPYNDHGWSEAHYDAGLYVQENIPGSEFLYIDNVNISGRPDSTPAQLAEELVGRGATVIIFNSDDMKESAHEFTAAHPEIIVIHASGDGAWKDGKGYKNFPNLSNTMGRMEYGKMMGGCAAALTTQTGKIGYLGPLINEETRRLASAVYLGAKYCFEKYAGKDPATLSFKVTWIGFWFNIPGFTLDPTQVADEFFNGGYDVVISGIDTTEATVEANRFKGEGKSVWAIPYDYKGACEVAPDICLGVPFFNWGPEYLRMIGSVADGTFTPEFTWLSPDWTDINNPDTSMVGFEKGAALSAEASTKLDQFIAELSGGLNLWKGPLNLQDGTQYLADGVAATDLQIWYLPQLLEGMEGQSLPQ
jgi:simple sugar transport system substrate-binding protein